MKEEMAKLFRESQDEAEKHHERAERYKAEVHQAAVQRRAQERSFSTGGGASDCTWSPSPTGRWDLGGNAVKQISCPNVMEKISIPVRTLTKVQIMCQGRKKIRK